MHPNICLLQKITPLIILKHFKTYMFFHAQVPARNTNAYVQRIPLNLKSVFIKFPIESLKT